MEIIGIIGAMDEEVAKLKEKMTEVEVKEKASMSFFEGRLNGKRAVVVRSGIGKVNAAVCAQILIDDYKADMLVNTGVAGALHCALNIGDIVLSSDALHHDMDVTGFGYEPGMIPRMKESIFTADKNILLKTKEICEKVNPEIKTHIGRVVSGDCFVSGSERKKYIFETFGGYCTEMEGAAIAQTAYLNNIPFLIIRAISDKADGSATMDYKEFEIKAIEHTVRLVEELVREI